MRPPAAASGPAKDRRRASFQKYFDRERNRLVYIGREADEDFWDARWQSGDFADLIRVNARRNRFFVKYSRKYLPAGARILEGGCGRGDKVYSLQQAGFEAYGVDFAPATVGQINALAPELKITRGDVRALDFPDGFFDGYWSVGVIEHFYEGYDAVQQEMRRVLRPGGFLFLTMPAMSWLRRRKASLNQYPAYTGETALRRDFYQFALDPNQVIRDFAAAGFQLAEVKLRNGFLGLQEELEWPPLRKTMQQVERGHSILLKRVRQVLDGLMTPYANHSVLLVLQRQ